MCTATPSPSTVSDRLLARRAAAGDQQAFEDLFARHNERMRRSAASILGNRHDVDDAVQEAWIRVLGRLNAIREDAGAFVGVIARNEALRDIDRRGRRPLPVEELPEPMAATDSLDGGLRLKEALGAVSDLPESQGQVAVLAMLGYTPAESAEALGISPEATRVRLHRARRTVAVAA